MFIKQKILFIRRCTIPTMLRLVSMKPTWTSQTTFIDFLYCIQLFLLTSQVYDPNYAAASLDEAYLDVTNYCAAEGMSGAQVRLPVPRIVTLDLSALVDGLCRLGRRRSRRSLIFATCGDATRPNRQRCRRSRGGAVLCRLLNLNINMTTKIINTSTNIRCSRRVRWRSGCVRGWRKRRASPAPVVLRPTSG